MDDDILVWFEKVARTKATNRAGVQRDCFFCLREEEEERDWTRARLVPPLFVYSGPSMIEYFSRMCDSIRQQQQKIPTGTCRYRDL